MKITYFSVILFSIQQPAFSHNYDRVLLVTRNNLFLWLIFSYCRWWVPRNRIETLSTRRQFHWKWFVRRICDLINVFSFWLNDWQIYWITLLAVTFKPKGYSLKSCLQTRYSCEIFFLSSAVEVVVWSFDKPTNCGINPEGPPTAGKEQQINGRMISPEQMEKSGSLIKSR